MTPARAAAADFAHVRFISAGAGSGKTYRLTEELERALVRDRIAPARVIGTTFTVKAAAELRAIRGQTHPRIEPTIARTRREIDAGLTPEQRTRAAELGERRRGPR